MLARSPQAAEAPPLPTKPDDKEAVIAEMQAFRPLATPRRVRYQRQIIAVAVVAAIVGLSALGVHVWRILGPSPLDVVKTEILEPPTVLRPDVPPAPPPAIPVAAPAVDLPQRRADPASSRGTITHTRRTDSVSAAAGARPSPQQPAVRAPEPRPVVQVECSEAVAALGLCAPTSSAKAAQ